MSSVENIGSSFFPKTKSNSVHEAAKLLKRNSVERTQEIDTKTRDDAKVDVAAAVKDFAQIKKVADATPPKDNTDKIADLKARINAGTYEIDFDALADKVLVEEF